MVPLPRLRLPRVPDSPPPYKFPVITALAPVVISVVIWLITSSAFVLLFAAMGPVAAVAGWLDSKVTNRRLLVKQAAAFDGEVQRALAEIERCHGIERAHLREVTPDATDLVTRRGSDPLRWRGDITAGVVITPGTGAITSTLETEPVPDVTEDGSRDRLRDLSEKAKRLEAAPIPVDARLGVAIVGPVAIAASVARCLAIQLAWTLSPAKHWWASSIAEELEWLTELPHERREPTTRGGAIEFGIHGDDVPAVVIAIAGPAEQLPRSCRVVIEVGARSARVTQHPSPGARGAIQPGAVTRQHALAWAREQSVQAQTEGLGRSGPPIPAEVAFSEVRRGDDAREGHRSLDATIGVSADGPVSLDLVSDGPHSVVGGTTGSGKSELLTTWVLAISAVRSPTEVTFLLVDFKGGSAFAPLASLPHIVGIVTDLDASGALRALESLRSEVRYRERLLLDEGVRSIEETDRAPRLVIVVDEYAAIVTEHPDLHALFSDLAARGRSLGIHLILCTQRPSGIIRDGVLANIDLRVSLRVNNRNDSMAVVGTEAAAAIPATSRGRAVVRLAEGDPRHVQVARASPEDVAVVASRWAGTAVARRVWCDPLPTRIEIDELEARARPLAAGAVAIGLVDLPSEQRQELALYTPREDGHLLVLGTGRSGKSNLVNLLASRGAHALLVPSGIDGAWDALEDVADLLDNRGGADDGARLVIIDDVDSLVARFPGEYRQVFIELLGRVLRDGPGHGIHAVITGQRLSGDLQAVMGLVPSRVMLRHGSRHDFVLAGGDGAHFIDSLPAGGGLWRGNRIQIALATALPDAPRFGREVALPPGRPVALVSSQSQRHLQRLPGALSIAEVSLDLSAPLAAGAIFVGDADDWQSRWGALSSLRSRAEIVFEGCSPADFRALTRTRTLPPPIVNAQSWMLADDGSVHRVRLPW